ncbi:MAG: nitrous oxide reductase accessory protein NosL [Thermomicrobiales bacterium]|nr:nitrous oxide reductase accessory protein NosL [Thermomicrobiales bacterium]
MISRRLLLLGLAGVSLGACGGSSSAEGPPKISYGEAVCDRCRMLISEERHAAAITVKGDDALLFDDIGEMIATAQERRNTGDRMWVHDFDERGWLDADKAWFVYLPNRTTPMATGIIAFEDSSRAQAKAQERGGWVKSWSEILSDWSIES